uniref:Uncharacterized protein n=1 Tax=Arundo donax TaxID=35708 RepID=A0A0A9DJ35_ARUDO
MLMLHLIVSFLVPIDMKFLVYAATCVKALLNHLFFWLLSNLVVRVVISPEDVAVTFPNDLHCS